MKQLRNVVHIDEALCNGCGQCVTACAEGAIEIVDGKARLVSEVYCDGLGACLGHCPQGAITVEQRPAEAFDEQAVRERRAEDGQVTAMAPQLESAGPAPVAHQGCPGSLARLFQAAGEETATETPQSQDKADSQLRNWPVQLALAPPAAPYYEGADILLSADCAPFSYPDFHRDFLRGRLALVGCPKLDNRGLYEEKLTAIFAAHAVRSVEVLYMEVPCCTGLAHLVRRAIQAAGRDIPLRLTRLGLRGEVLESLDQPRVAL